jgi:hypothetical protein
MKKNTLRGLLNILCNIIIMLSARASKQVLCHLLTRSRCSTVRKLSEGGYEDFYLLGYSSLKVVRYYGGTCRLHYRGRRIIQARDHSLDTCFILISCLVYSSTPKTVTTRSSKTLVDFNGLHGFVSQKTKLFITSWIPIPHKIMFSEGSDVAM